MLETTSGAVPVATVDVSEPETERLVPLAAPIFGVVNVGEVVPASPPVPLDVPASSVATPVPGVIAVNAEEPLPTRIPVRLENIGALENVSTPLNVCVVPSPATVAEAAGKVNVVPSVPARVSELLTVSVFPNETTTGVSEIVQAFEPCRVMVAH